MIDWPLAGRIARGVAGRPTHGAPPTAGLDELVADAAARVSAYTGLEAGSPLPGPEAVDRPEWLDASHRNARELIEPAAERLTASLGTGRWLPAGPARAAAGTLLAVEIGAVTGFLAQRVLGQYDIDLLADHPPGRAPRLLLVTPNVAEAAAKLSVPREELLHWVAIHEVTHAVQFQGVGWLRAHLGGLIEELLDGLEASFDPAALLRLPSADDLRGLVDAVRRGEVMTLAVGPERRELLDRMQAAMALIEGHAEHVMDAVGAELLPSLPRLRAALDRRRASGPLAVRLIGRLLGLDAKLRQYVLGKRFCDAVVDAGGTEALARAFSEPAALPTLAELDEPAAWRARVG